MKVDPLLIHEALDRSQLILSMFEDQVSFHPGVRCDDALVSMAEDISERLFGLYQLIGEKRAGVEYERVSSDLI